ncbi:MAG: ORF6N domain-containing protein [Candidatus Marinimicrobia bacterium]|nr:ORF6N domain-containing protein [Candidatus Neomarinimicrobiota bacterium]
MSDNTVQISREQIQNFIFTIRGVQVMLDSDLAEIYGVEVKRLNEQVKRNIDRFPENFRFQLTKEEYDSLKLQSVISSNNPLRSQIATSKEIDEDLKSQIATSSSEHGGRRKLPYAFTEQGVSMLSAVLRSKTAIKASINIMNAFVEMKKFIASNAGIFQRLENIELKQIKYDDNFDKLFKALEEKSIKPSQGIFFNGQIYDAYTFVADLVRSAKKSIVLIDNFIDDTVLTILSKRNDNVSATIYTKSISKQLKLDLAKHNQQYSEISVIRFADAHDRFIIIDDEELYHFGASLKDLGKKWFAFSKMTMDNWNLMQRLNGGES